MDGGPRLYYKLTFQAFGSGELIMVTTGPGVKEQKSLENVNSCEFETKVKGHPLTLTLIYFYILGQ